MIISPPPPPSAYADVTRFGADPTGTNDSTAAFLAAEASLPANGGVVFMPPGTYKTTGIAFTKKSTSLWGSGAASETGVGASVIDASGMTLGGGTQTYVLSWPGNTWGVSLKDFMIKMPSSSGRSAVNYNQGLCGIYLGGFADDFMIMRVTTEGGDIGLRESQDNTGKIVACRFQNLTSHAWVLGSSFSVSADACLFSNAQADRVLWVNDSGIFNESCHMKDCCVDEGGAAFNTSSSVYIQDANACSVRDCEIFVGNAASGVNYGIRIADGSLGAHRTLISGCRILGYQSVNNTQAATIYLGSTAVATVLENIETNPQGGANDIIDKGAGTIYRNVNGQSSIPLVTPRNTLTVSGTPAAGDTIPLVITNASVDNSPITVTYTVVGGDTVNSIAANLATAVQAAQFCWKNGIFATASGATVTVFQPGVTALSTVLSCTPTHGGGGTEAVAFSPVNGHLVTVAATATDFQTAPYFSFSAWGVSPLKITGQGTFPTGIPAGQKWDVTNSKLWFLDQSNTPHFITYT